MISDTFRGSVIAALVLTLAIAVPLYVRILLADGPTREDGLRDASRAPSSSAANLRGSLK